MQLVEMLHGTEAAMVVRSWERGWLPLEPPLGHLLCWRPCLLQVVSVIFPNFLVSTGPGDSAALSSTLPFISCPRQTLHVLQSQSHRDMCVCKGDYLLSQANRQGNPSYFALFTTLFGSS